MASVSSAETKKGGTADYPRPFKGGGFLFREVAYADVVVTINQRKYYQAKY